MLLLKGIGLFLFGSIAGKSLYNIKNTNNKEILRISLSVSVITICIPVLLLLNTKFFNSDWLIAIYMYSLLSIFCLYEFNRVYRKKRIL